MQILAKKRQRGFTLLGVLISAFIVVIVVSALVSLLAQSYGVARTSKNRFIAINLAKEGVELVRNMRDGNWLFYPDPTLNPTGYATKIKWRGEATDTSSCGGKHCSRLRSICNSTGDGFIVDALQQDLTLQPVSGDNEIIKINDDGVYNHQTGADTIFRRVIQIESAGNCGEFPDSAVDGTVAPGPVTVRSIVTWYDAETGSTKTVELKETLSDWILSRGVAP